MTVLAIWPETARAECDGVATATWLAGTWRQPNDLQTMVIRRDGDKLVWTYERLAGVKSEKWGDKVPAAAAGTVEAVDDCRAILKGRYTRYDGRGDPRRPAVGWPMEWKFRMTAPGEVVSEGLGYGQERFNVRWQKRQ